MKPVFLFGKLKWWTY